MDTQQAKYAQMHAKLREGLQLLSEDSREETHTLNAALIKLHSALEDFLRIAVAQKAPHLREKVEDLGQTAWDELIAYGKQYLGFSESDARIVRAADRQCQNVAHGNNYSGSRDELAEYGAFVKKWCSADRRQGRLVTILAYAVLVLIFLCGIGVVSSSVFLADTWLEILAQLNIPLVPPRIPEPTVSPTLTAVPSEAILATSTPPAVLAAADAVCTVVWVEHPEDHLARKSRSRVWEQIVQFRVEGSGMTPRQFYDLVVEHNPQLEADDYEFKEGKTYLLPECQ